MDDLPNRLHLLDSSLEESNFICNAALSKLVYSKCENCYGRERNRPEEVCMTVNDKTILW
jgi:uncharacterized OB-fold protein